MCKLLIATNKKRNNKLLSQLITAQFTQMGSEKDGLSALIVDRNGEMKAFKELDNYGLVFNEVKERLKTAAFLGLHARTATCGIKSLENIHFFQDKGYYMAHNGWVDAYYYGATAVTKGGDRAVNEINQLNGILERCYECGQDQDGYCVKHTSIRNRLDKLQVSGADDDNLIVSSADMQAKECDTIRFLRSIEKPITEARLKWAVDDKGFSGFAVIYDSKKKQAWYLIHKEVKFITDLKTFSCLFSYEPEMTAITNKTKEFMGFYYKVSDSEVDLSDKLKDYTFTGPAIVRSDLRKLKVISQRRITPNAPKTQKLLS